MTYKGTITVNYNDWTEEEYDFTTDDLHKFIRDLKNYDEITSLVVVLGLD